MPKKLELAILIILFFLLLFFQENFVLAQALLPQENQNDELNCFDDFQFIHPSDLRIRDGFLFLAESEQEKIEFGKDLDFAKSSLGKFYFALDEHIRSVKKQLPQQEEIFFEIKNSSIIENLSEIYESHPDLFESFHVDLEGDEKKRLFNFFVEKVLLEPYDKWIKSIQINYSLPLDSFCQEGKCKKRYIHAWSTANQVNWPITHDIQKELDTLSQFPFEPTYAFSKDPLLTITKEESYELEKAIHYSNHLVTLLSLKYNEVLAQYFSQGIQCRQKPRNIYQYEIKIFAKSNCETNHENILFSIRLGEQYFFLKGNDSKDFVFYSKGETAIEVDLFNTAGTYKLEESLESSKCEIEVSPIIVPSERELDLNYQLIQEKRTSFNILKSIEESNRLGIFDEAQKGLEYAQNACSNLNYKIQNLISHDRSNLDEIRFYIGIKASQNHLEEIANSDNLCDPKNIRLYELEGEISFYLNLIQRFKKIISFANCGNNEVCNSDLNELSEFYVFDYKQHILDLIYALRLRSDTFDIDKQNKTSNMRKNLCRHLSDLDSWLESQLIENMSFKKLDSEQICSDIPATEYN